MPEGARLIGATLPRPGKNTGEGWFAVLVVDRDPIGTWDRFASAARQAGYRLNGSAARCGRDPLRGSPDPGLYLACLDSATRQGAGGANHRVLTATLEWHRRRTLMYVSVATGSSPVRPEPPSDPAPASPSSFPDLPTPERPQRLAGPGEPFGDEHNCFERSYDRFVVPPGTHLAGPVGDYGDWENLAVLAVTETTARRALEHLAHQLTAGASGFLNVYVLGISDPPAIERRHTAAGDVLTLSHSVGGGGGSCWATSSPDGRWIIIGTHSD